MPIGQMKEQTKEQIKEQTISEWFSSGQRVSCMFYSSLLDAEGRKEYVSCHLLEPPGGLRPSSPGLAPASPMPTTQSAPIPSALPGPMQPTESAPLSSTQPYNKESVTRQSIGAKSKADDGQEEIECITLLHGYPTCSYDYYPLVQRLRQDPNLRYKLLLIDMLGYGDSDKGVGEARFSIQQHANVVCAVWQRYDIKSSHLVVHDFAVSVAQELLYREPKNRLPIRLAKVFWLNGSVFIDLYRPPLLQRLCCSMLSKPAGWVMSQLLAAAVTQAFSKDYPPSKQMLEDVETSLRNRGGDKIHHKLIRFMKDRERYKYLWQGALELAMRQDSSRMMFYWGMQDPLSGAHVAAEIHRRYDKYNVRIVERPDLGHWPHLEDPDRVAEALIEFLQEPWRSRRDMSDTSCRAGNAYHVSVRNGTVSLAPGYQPAFRRRSQSIDRGNSFRRPSEDGDRSCRALVKAPPTIDEIGGRGPAEPAAAPQVTETNGREAVKATIST